MIGLVAGCSPVPATTPLPSATAPATSSPPSTATPTATAASSPQGPTGLGDTWERIELPGERPEPIAAVNGLSGLVIVGRQCIGANAHGCTQTASAWRSDDEGATWQLALVDDAENTFLREVVYNGSYVAFGIRYERRGEARRAVGILWHSGDGSDWRRFGSIELGDCTEEGCPYAIGLHANEDGPFLLDRVLTNLMGPGPPYRSADGNEWTPIPAGEFGLVHSADVIITDALATSPGFYALLTGNDLPLTAWTSEDGATWSAAGSFDVVTDTSASLTLGAELVVARGSCSPSACRTSIWVGSQDGGFEETDASFELVETRVTYTGPTGYLLVGLDHGAPRASTSLDARTWTRGDPGPPTEQCGVGWLAGGPSLAIFMGELGCGDAWITHGVASE
jgi:hypothetical protein